MLRNSLVEEDLESIQTTLISKYWESLTLTKLHQSLNLINNLVEVQALTNCIIYTPSNTRIPQSEQYIASVHSHISNVCNIVRCQIFSK